MKIYNNGLLTQCIGDSKKWCRYGNQQLGQTKGRIASLCCQLLHKTHWCEECKDLHLCFPRIQSLSHHDNHLLRITEFTFQNIPLNYI